MPLRPAQVCPHRSTTEELASHALAEPTRSTAEQHLADCEPCRAHFRQLLGDEFPKIRNYTLVAELGRGGFGVVYRAVHHGKKRTEALKVLSDRSAQRAAYFENEVHLAAQLRHPNIATLYEANLSASPLYYAMEYVAGDQMDDYLRGHDLSLEQRIRLLQTIAQAVGYAHRQGVIHRDLKPQNILIDPQGQPHIIDFGIAKSLAPKTPADTDEQVAPLPEAALGTYGYIPPEQLAGHEVDSRADVYSLGVLLFHMITGHRARAVPHAERFAEALRERQVSRAGDLAAIIACCVQPLPEQRYPNCELLAADLDDYLAGRPVRALIGQTAGYRLKRISALILRQHPLPVHILAAMAVACLFTWVFWHAGAGWLSPPTHQDQTVLVAVLPSTLEAANAGRIGSHLPGFALTDRKSWRLLYGQLLERLAVARPRAVVWDYFFPTCSPAFDAGFIRGIQALDTPVVVGSENPDLNGEPQLCPDLRAALHGWGVLLGTRNIARENAIVAPLALQRGFNPPIPSIALAGFAATRHPGHDLDIRVEKNSLNLRYKKRTIVSGEARWHPSADEIPFFYDDVVAPDQNQATPGDHPLLGRFPLEPVRAWAARAIPFEDVLTAPEPQCRAWFADRTVLIGQMLPGSDLHPLGSAGPVFGCQIQASVLDALLCGAQSHRFTRWSVAIRMCVWSLLAALAVRLLPLSRVWPARASVVIAWAVIVGMALVAIPLGRLLTGLWPLEAAMALCTLLASGAAAGLIRHLHLRQSRLTPGDVWSAEGTTASTTVLAASGMPPHGAISVALQRPPADPSRSQSPPGGPPPDRDRPHTSGDSRAS